jgi:hypothetical protein
MVRLRRSGTAVWESKRTRGCAGCARSTLAPAFRAAGCANHDLPVEARSVLYQRFGETKGGDPRPRRKGCAKTFSTGKSARRRMRSDKNRLVPDRLCNDLSLEKVSGISGLT